MKVDNRKFIGSDGEIAACKYLKKNKYKIIETNYKTKVGEIDIICKNKDNIVFVEVKTRKKDAAVSGVYSVNFQKQSHILKTSHLYLCENKTDLQPRYDVIEVEFDTDGNYYVVNHFENAFMQGGEYAVF